MQCVILLSILSILLSHTTFGEQDGQGRIYGGYQIDIQKAPYMAQLYAIKGEYVPGQPTETGQCGGSIMKSNLILTAGHCVIKDDGTVYPPDKMFVYIGSTITPGGEMVTVKKIHVHPKYKGQKTHYYHDIAILELEDDITLDHTKAIGPIAKPTDKTKPGDDVFVSGWGTNPDHPGDSRLYQVHLKVMSAQTCKDKVGGGEVSEIEEHNICAGAKKKAHCEGDSGGPLIDASTKRQVGLVSWGTVDCTNSLPRYYTKLADNMDFIDKVVQGASSKDDTSETCDD